MSTSESKLVGEAAGDRAGGRAVGAGNVDGHGAADLLVGAEFDDTGAEDAGAAYVLLGQAFPGRSGEAPGRDGDEPPRRPAPCPAQ